MIRVEAAKRLLIISSVSRGLRLQEVDAAAEITVPDLAKQLQRRFGTRIAKADEDDGNFHYELMFDSGDDCRDQVMGFLKGRGLTRVGKLNGIIDVYPPKWGKSHIKIVRLHHNNGRCIIEIKGQEELQ